MIRWFANLFAPAAATPEQPSAPPTDFRGPVTWRMPDVFPGQVKDATLLFNDALIQKGRDLVDSDTELRPEIHDQIDAMALAQGQAWCASVYDADKRRSDGRDTLIRAERDADLAAERSRLVEAEADLIAATEELNRTESASPALAGLGYLLSGVAAAAGAVVLYPSVDALLGPTFVAMVGPSYAFAAAVGAAGALAFAPPLVAIASASMRAPAWKFAVFAVAEVAALGLLAWARIALFTLPTGVGNASMGAFMADQAEARSLMMFAFEAMLVLVVNGIGAQLSSHLGRAEVHRLARERVSAAADRRENLSQRRDSLDQWRDGDVAVLAERDVESERGEKVELLARALILQGALEQVQANRALLTDSPRAMRPKPSKVDA